MTDENSETSESRAPGTTTIAPNVLVTIAQLTALRVEGVIGLAPLPAAVDRLFRRGLGDGVDIEVKDGEVNAKLYLVLAPNVNVRDVSRQVQMQVARTIEEMVGMQAARIDVHIQDIGYGDPTE
ncbi:MAG: Asp23/Gls24 family envelope stress response protein [Anaerolineales bacterium]